MESPSAAVTPHTSLERLPASQRRELTLRAAIGVFAARGYHGATTERIARAAGISQPYVVRMFGSKEQLFLTLVERCSERVVEDFRAALHDRSTTRSPQARLGDVYRRLATTDGVHVIMMQAYMLGGDPEIGPAARTSFTRVLTLLIDEAGFSISQVRNFLARGMLVNTLLGIRLQDHPHPSSAQLWAEVFDVDDFGIDD